MAKNTKIQSTLLLIVFIIAFIGFMAKLLAKLISIVFPIIAIAGAFIGLLYLIYYLYVESYFKSKNFKTIKSGIHEYIDNCNSLNHHINELKNSFSEIKNYNYGRGELSDNSNYNFQRSEWDKIISNEYIHNCSASVLKNASNQPFKYLCKYFNIEANEQKLEEFERLLNDFSAAEEGKELLKNERETVIENTRKSIPWIIYKYHKDRLENKLGFDEYEFDDLYFPVYSFQYVSAGGNSSSNFDIKLNIPNLEDFIYYLNDLVSFRKSIAGQRALMTTKLRLKIKIRDNYKCCNCDISIDDERNLLLEIDHIIPLSKGGITTEENLQTLCWRCNRTKGAKIE
jgi:hypothetical protein